MKNFIDEARIFVHSGKGGDGAIAFLREKYRPFGGPAGGDGGKGGDVIFEVNEGISTLLDFKYKPRLIARNGESGRGKEQYGKSATDLVVSVPPGTVVIDEESGEVLADMVLPGQREVIAQGGDGGTRQHALRLLDPTGPAHRHAWRTRRGALGASGIAPGGRGGTGGMPNAGKSTLLAALSAARPKDRALPFHDADSQSRAVMILTKESFTVADIPGLIEGAHEGQGSESASCATSRGLGYWFSFWTDRGHRARFRTVRREIKAFDPELAASPRDGRAQQDGPRSADRLRPGERPLKRDHRIWR